MTINVGAVVITFIGLVVGLAGLGLAWRLVRGLPTDDHSTSVRPETDEAPGEAGDVAPAGDVPPAGDAPPESGA